MSKRAVVVLLSVVALVVGGGAWATATVIATSSTVKACVTSKGAIRSASAGSACPKGTKARAINVTGPRGATGARGATGPQGPGAASMRATLSMANGPYALLSEGPISISGSCVGGFSFKVTQGNGGQVGRMAGRYEVFRDGVDAGGYTTWSPSNGEISVSTPSNGANVLVVSLDALVAVLPAGSPDARVYDVRIDVYRYIEGSCDVMVRITP